MAIYYNNRRINPSRQPASGKEVFMKKLVRLWKRPSRDGKRFVFVLDYRDETNKRRQISLGHTDARKAERQRAQKERELRMGVVGPVSMKMSEFREDRTNNVFSDAVIPHSLCHSRQRRIRWMASSCQHLSLCNCKHNTQHPNLYLAPCTAGGFFTRFLTANHL